MNGPEIRLKWYDDDIVIIPLHVEESADGDDDSVAHYWCCNPKQAMCGTAIDCHWDDPIAIDQTEPDDCVVCIDLYTGGGCDECRE